jgi:hypothetical protein
MKKLLLTILLNVLLLLPVVGWGGVHGCNSCEEWTSSETLGLQIRASEGDATGTLVKTQGQTIKIAKILRSNSVDGTISTNTVKIVWP